MSSNGQVVGITYAMLSGCQPCNSVATIHLGSCSALTYEPMHWVHDVTLRCHPAYLLTAVVGGHRITAEGINLCQQLRLHIWVLCNEVHGKCQG